MSTLEIRHISRNFWLLTPFLLLWEKSAGSSKEEWQYLSSKLCLTKRCVCLVLLKKLRSLFLFLSCTLWGLMRPRHQYLSRTHYHLDSFLSHIRYLHSGTQMYLRAQVHTGTQRYIQVHTGTHMYTGTGTHRYTLPLGKLSFSHQIPSQMISVVLIILWRS